MPQRIIDDANYGKLDLDVYSVKDLAGRLGVKLDTIHNAIKRGDLAALNLGGSAGFRIYKDAVTAWLSGGGIPRARKDLPIGALPEDARLHDERVDALFGGR